MRRVAPKRAQLNRAAQPWREALKLRIGRCEHCLKSKAPEYLDCDEISRGSSRAKSLTEASCILVVCRPCHSIVQPWSRARRLALLYLARSSEYSLERFWEVTGRRFPEQAAVDLEIADLLEQPAPVEKD